MLAEFFPINPRTTALAKGIAQLRSGRFVWATRTDLITRLLEFRWVKRVRVEQGIRPGRGGSRRWKEKDQDQRLSEGASFAIIDHPRDRFPPLSHLRKAGGRPTPNLNLTVSSHADFVQPKELRPHPSTSSRLIRFSDADHVASGTIDADSFLHP